MPGHTRACAWWHRGPQNTNSTRETQDTRQRYHCAQTPKALKLLYDEDVVDEEFLQAWYAKPNAAKVLEVPEEAAAAVRKAAQPFITWLEEAEEDESDEE